MELSRHSAANAASPAGAGPARWWLLLIFALALWLRLWGATFGLPFNYQVSENMYIAAAQGAPIADPGGLPPLFGVYQWLLRAEAGLLDLLGWQQLDLSPRWQAIVRSPETRLNLLGRATSALFGALSVFPAFWIGRRLWNRQVGLIAALLVAVTFLHVRSSHHAKPEIMAGFLALTAAYLALDFGRDGSWRRYLLAGVATGLALSAKLLAWPIVAVVYLLHLAGREVTASLRSGRIGKALGAALDPRIFGCAAATLATFVACSPQSILNPKNYFVFWRWVALIGEGGGLERFDTNGGLAAWRVYVNAFSWGVGLVLTAFIVAGLVRALRRGAGAEIRILLVFPLLLMLFLLKPGYLANERYVLLPVLFLLLPAAWTIDALGRRFRLRPAAVALLLAVVVAQPAVASMRHDYLLAQKDTRTLAKEWIEENIPEGSAVALDFWFFSPQLQSEGRPVPLSERTYQVSAAGPYGLGERSGVSGESRGTLSLLGYLLTGYEYIVSTGYSIEIPRLEAEDEKVKRNFHRSLDERATLIREFSPVKPGRAVPFYFPHVMGPAIKMFDLERNGPSIKIYRLPEIGGAGRPGAEPAAVTPTVPGVSG